jgi:hypothetical protein
MLFDEIIAVYSENHKKKLSALCRQNEKLIVVELVKKSPALHGT